MIREAARFWRSRSPEIHPSTGTSIGLDAVPRGTLEVTILAAPARVGGLETVVAALALGLARRGHQVRVLSLLGTGADDRCVPFESLGAAGVEVTEGRFPGRSYRRERDWVAERLARLPGTVVHCHGYHADLVGWWATRRVPRPMMSTAHGFSARTARGRVYEWLDRWVLARSDAAIAVSRPLRELLIGSGVAAARVHLVVNAWSAGGAPLDRGEARRRLGLPEGGPAIGWVGRLTSEKGPDVMVAAAAALPRETPVSMIGEGAMGPALHREAQRLGLTAVRWHGMVPAAASLMGAFDVIALSSRTEGTPMVLLDAMATGVPIVTTAVGGIPDLISPTEAILVPPDDPTALAAAIRRCLEDPAAARARAEAARGRLHRDHQESAWLDRHEAIYRSIGCR